MPWYEQQGFLNLVNTVRMVVFSEAYAERLPVGRTGEELLADQTGQGFC